MCLGQVSPAGARVATHNPVHVDELFGELKQYDASRLWYVVHTKPRCEKKLAEHARKNAIPYYLPQYTATSVYQRRKVTFSKVMFPGYLFAVVDINHRQTLSLSGWVVNFIKVTAQQQLLHELQCIHGTHQAKDKVKPGVWLGKGLQVEISSGPLQGVKGVVESHDKLSEVRLQVSILHQAVIVSVDPAIVKIIGEYELVEQEG